MAEVCRLCLKDKNLKNIYNTKEKLNIEEIIWISCGVTIKKTDPVPQKICETCLQISLKIYKFRTMSLKNNETLLKDMNESTNVASNTPTITTPKESIATNTKVETTKNMHQSFKKILKKYPNIKFPRNIQLEHNYDPSITVFTNEITKYQANYKRSIKETSTSNCKKNKYSNKKATATIKDYQRDSIKPDSNLPIENTDKSLQNSQTFKATEVIKSSSELENILEGNLSPQKCDIHNVSVSSSKNIEKHEKSQDIEDNDSNCSTNFCLQINEKLEEDNSACEKSEFVKSLHLDPTNSLNLVPSTSCNESLFSRIHKSQTLYTCKICNSNFNSRWHLRTHQEKNHTRCQFCKKKFRTIKLKNQHNLKKCGKLCVQQRKLCIVLERVDKNVSIVKKYPSAFKNFPCSNDNVSNGNTEYVTVEKIVNLEEEKKEDNESLETTLPLEQVHTNESIVENNSNLFEDDDANKNTLSETSTALVEDTVDVIKEEEQSNEIVKPIKLTLKRISEGNYDIVPVEVICIDDDDDDDDNLILAKNPEVKTINLQNDELLKEAANENTVSMLQTLITKIIKKKAPLPNKDRFKSTTPKFMILKNQKSLLRKNNISVNISCSKHFSLAYKTPSVRKYKIKDLWHNVPTLHAYKNKTQKNVEKKVENSIQKDIQSTSVLEGASNSNTSDNSGATTCIAVIPPFNTSIKPSIQIVVETTESIPVSTTSVSTTTASNSTSQANIQLPYEYMVNLKKNRDQLHTYFAANRSIVETTKAVPVTSTDTSTASTSNLISPANIQQCYNSVVILEKKREQQQQAYYVANRPVVETTKAMPVTFAGTSSTNTSNSASHTNIQQTYNYVAELQKMCEQQQQQGYYVANRPVVQSSKAMPVTSTATTSNSVSQSYKFMVNLKNRPELQQQQQQVYYLATRPVVETTKSMPVAATIVTFATTYNVNSRPINTQPYYNSMTNSKKSQKQQQQPYYVANRTVPPPPLQQINLNTTRYQNILPNTNSMGANATASGYNLIHSVGQRPIQTKAQSDLNTTVTTSQASSEISSVIRQSHTNKPSISIRVKSIYELS